MRDYDEEHLRSPSLQRPMNRAALGGRQWSEY